MTHKTHLRMTASERAMGRFMRAPDHPVSGGNEEGTPSADQADSGEALTTEEQLEREFGVDEDSPSNSDDDDSEAGSEDDDATDEEDDSDDEDSGDDADEESEEEASEGESGTSDTEESEEVKALKTRADEAERELARVKAAAEAAGVSTDIATDDIQVPTEPDPETYKYGELDENYRTDRAKYEAKMEILQDQAKARFKVEAAALEANWTKNLAGAVTRYPDFNEVVVKGAEEKKWPCTPVVSVAIKNSEFGPDIAYELASNPAEAERISKLSWLEQAREFGALEERQRTKAATAKAERDATNVAARRISKAPTPPKKQVRGKGGKFRTPADTDDFAAFEKLADKIGA